MSAQPTSWPSREEYAVAREIRDMEGLEQLLVKWSALASAREQPSIFLTPEWALAWWRAYGAGRELRVLAMESGSGALLGIVPLYLERRRWWLGKLRVLRLMGDGSADSDDLDWLAREDSEAAVAEAVARWLSENEWDIAEFNALGVASLAGRTVEEMARAKGWHCEGGARPQARIEFRGSWEEYLKTLTGKERRKIGHRYRHLAARYALAIRRCESENERRGFLDTLYSLHQKRWRERGEPGNFALAARREFYEEMTRELLSQGWLELWLLELDGRAVAAQIGMRYGRAVYALQEGFDPEFAADSVGYVLRSRILQYCVESGAASYDFLYGDQESKLRWGATLGSYVDLRVARAEGRGARAMALWAVWRTAKARLRERLPEALWRQLQRWRRGFRAASGGGTD